MDEELNVNEEVVTPEDTEAEISEEETEEVAAPKQSAEENAKFAEIRRKYESENKQIRAELEAERASKKQYADEVVSTAYKGQVNPYTERPIETQEDFDEYQEMYREDVLSQLGVSKDFIKQEIENNPIVRQAQQILETQKAQQGKAIFAERLAEISKLNPAIKTVADLINMPNREEFDHYVIDKHYDIVDAYKLANPDTKKRQSTAETKDHLIKTGGNGGGGTEIEIPSGELEYYKETFTGETNAQLRARYNRVLKRQGE